MPHPVSSRIENYVRRKGRAPTSVEGRRRRRDPAGVARSGREDPDVFEDEQWRWDVLLVLIATDYAPFTDVARPAGNVVYLDPSTETAHLISLHEAGLVSFLQHQTA